MAPAEPQSPYMIPVNNNTKWQNFVRAIWNPEEKRLIGRTAQGWGILLIFYALFYAVLAALFSICMFALLRTIPEDRPMYSLHESLIGTNPGMGFRPQFVDDGYLIHYNRTNVTSVAKYVQDIEQMLQAYTNLSHPDASSRVQCTFQQDKAPHLATQACLVNSAFGPCSAAESYGYSGTRPCIFIKINRIYGFEPDYHTSPEPDMPADLKAHIDSLEEEQRKQVWVSCDGEKPADRQALNHDAGVAGNVSYYPSPGIPQYYFPYRNQRGYVSPIVAVQFNNVEPGRVINIRCRAWAKNIEYSHSLKDIKGSTHIELRVD